MTAEPEPQDVEGARREFEHSVWKRMNTQRIASDDDYDRAAAETNIVFNRLRDAIRTDERTRWAEREKELVGALRDATRTATNVRRVLANNIKTRGAQSEATVEECIAALDLTIARAALGEERPA